MPVKYVVQKMKGAFYAGSETIAQSGRKLKRYASLDGVANMVKALHISASALVFRGVSKGEQKKIVGAKSAPKKKSKAKSKGKRKR